MKAAVNEHYGLPDVIEIKEVPKPVPGVGEVLVKVHATTVNRTDDGFLRAKPWFIRFFSGLWKPKQTILGNEFAGEVVEIGEWVSEFKVGDRVFGYREPQFGCHAQFLKMRETNFIAHMPEGMSYEEVAPGNEGAHYALTYIRKANIPDNPNQKVLVNGTTGAIGSAAVQLIKYYGAHVTAVCDTDRIELVKSLGADRIIDYKKEDFTKLDEQFDFVFDAVGKSSFFKCENILKPGGMFMATELGPYWNNTWLPLATKLFGGVRGKKIYFPFPFHSKEDVVFFKQLLERGDFKPVIDKTYPLEQIADAYRYVETGEKTGNVVITVSH